MRMAQLRSVLRNRLPDLGDRGTAGNCFCSAEELGRPGTDGQVCRSRVHPINRERDKSSGTGAANCKGRFRATFQTREGCFRASGQACNGELCHANRVDERAITGLDWRLVRERFYAEAAAASSSA